MMICWLFDDSCSHEVIIEIYKRQIKTIAVFLTLVQQVLLTACTATKRPPIRSLMSRYTVRRNDRSAQSGVCLVVVGTQLQPNQLRVSA